MGCTQGAVCCGHIIVNPPIRYRPDTCCLCRGKQCLPKGEISLKVIVWELVEGASYYYDCITGPFIPQWIASIGTPDVYPLSVVCLYLRLLIVLVGLGRGGRTGQVIRRSCVVYDRTTYSNSEHPVHENKKISRRNNAMHYCLNILEYSPDIFHKMWRSCNVASSNTLIIWW